VDGCSGVDFGRNLSWKIRRLTDCGQIGLYAFQTAPTVESNLKQEVKESWIGVRVCKEGLWDADAGSVGRVIQ